MKGRDYVSSRSRQRWRRDRNNTRWGRRGRSYGSEFVDISGCPWTTFVYVPQRVMASCTLYIKDLLFPKRGSKMLGTRYGSHQLSLFRLYVAKKDSLDTLSPIIWLDITFEMGLEAHFSFANPGPGGGFVEDLYISGGEFLNPAWICRLQSTHGMFFSEQGIRRPTIKKIETKKGGKRVFVLSL